MEALNPESERKTTPSAYEIFGSFPEEDGYSAAGHSGDCTRENKHATQCLAWGVHSRQDTKL
jgi:hypothetical protein